MRQTFILTALLAGALLTACGGAGATPGGGAPTVAGGQPTGAAVTDAAKLCDLLGPGDFAAVGISGAGPVKANVDESGAYCVYAGQSAGTGGIEFDAFVGDDAEGTFDTIMQESVGSPAAITVAGADEAMAADGVAGKSDQYASITVRKGKLVFTIGVPGGAGMSAKLATLAAVVLGRAAALTG
jgi:hypothetical protein